MKMFIHDGPFPARHRPPSCAIELHRCGRATEQQPQVGAAGWDRALPLLPLTAQLLTRFTFPYSKFPPCPVKILHQGSTSFLRVLGFSGSNSLLALMYFFSAPDNQGSDGAPWLEAERGVPHFGFKHSCYQQ